MIAWTQFPFLRFLLAFISGIVCYIALKPEYTFLPAILISAILYLTLFLWARGKARMHDLRPWLGLLGLSILFLCGLQVSFQNDQSLNPVHFMNQSGQISYYRGTVINDPEEKEKTFKAVISVEEIKTDTEWKPASGKICLYLKKENAGTPRYGDILFVKGSPQSVPAPGNPGEFDYRAYLARQNIFHQHFIKAGGYRFIGSDQANPVIAWSVSLRARSDDIMKRYIPSESGYKIASALVLGIRNSLDNEIREAYSNTGTMHILAVSGLHIVLIFQILSLICAPLKRLKYSQVFLPVIFIILLWFYALVTGLSASVLRAVTMFSFVIIARAISRNSNIYNTLALSAFMLLCCDPMLLCDVGFQLSYIAVLGIVYLHPKIYQAFDFSNAAADKVWEYTSISLAAQIATFPLGLLYFHQFPVYFLISNYLAIPLSFLVLYLGLALLAAGWIPIAAMCIGYLTDKIIWLMNSIVYGIEKLPWALIDGVYISQTQMLLIYAFIIFVLAFLYLKKLRYLSAAFLAVFLCSSFTLSDIFSQNKSVSVAIYNVKGHTALALIEGQQATLLLDSGLQSTPSKIVYHIQGHLIMNRMRIVNSHTLNNPGPEIKHHKYSGGMVIVWHGKKILIASKPAGDLRVKTDIAIIIDDAFKNIADAGQYIHSEKIIFDSSNRRQKPVFICLDLKNMELCR